MRAFLQQIAILFALASSSSSFFPLGHASSSSDKTIVGSAAQVQLLELYSTQSCSSCPPAQEWLSALKGRRELWQNFVPVVFHVDYWNYLGWKDPYSRPEFGRRQRRYAAQWKSSRIYTPMFVLGGQEWRERTTSFLKKKQKVVGILTATPEASSPGTYRIVFSSSESESTATATTTATATSSSLPPSLELYGAVLGNNVRTKIKAGENAGKTFVQDFLILDFKKSSIHRQKQNRRRRPRPHQYTGMISLSSSAMANKKQGETRSVAFWISSPTSLVPIQALGASLP